ncbi:MAG: U32 family peptidase [Nanoarchaeota archaeon]
MNKIELILPAGNWNCLKAAVENGADAVYLGIDKFNARRRADNFKLEELREVTKYAHQNGVKVYVTLNILIKNSEIEEFFQTVKELYLAQVDAVIIQELSFLPIIKKNFPKMEVHISTQAAITNTYFYELIKDADKVVLPREYSKEEIEHFIKRTKLPTEIFVQGALCFSYSGKCLFSSFLGGRSGNRGLCAQPCRRLYNRSYLLSMKDLSLVKKIPEIIEMGVSSLKIEGRLRSEKYVAAAAKTYRAAIDSYYAGKFLINKEYFKEMELAFNREFTWGYYSKDKQIISPERATGRGLFLGTIEAGNLIQLQEDVAIGDGLGIWLKEKVDGAILRKIEKDKKEIFEAKAGDKVKLFIRAPTGTRIYKTSSLKKPSEFIFEKNKPIKEEKREVSRLTLPIIKKKETGKEELLVKVYSKKDGEEALRAEPEHVFYNIFAEDYDSHFGAFVPRILNNEEVESAVKLVDKFKVKAVLVGDLGFYLRLQQKKEEYKNLKIYLDYSNNIFNDYDLEFLLPTIPIISPELSFPEMKDFQNKNFAVMVHGRIILMNTKYTALPSNLRDEKNYNFPVRKEHTYYQILNSVELGLFEEVLRLREAGIKRFFLDLNTEVYRTIKTYQKLLHRKKPDIDKEGFTKGHFEKGVD